MRKGVCYIKLNFLGVTGYRVGDDSSIWTKWCKSSDEFGRINFTLGDKWKKLNPGKRLRNPEAYPQVNLRTGVNTSHICALHRIVLSAFLGPLPSKMDSRHFPDRDRRNNKLENLSYCTRKRNFQDQIIHGTHYPLVPRQGMDNNKAKEAGNSEWKVRLIRRFWESGRYTQQELINTFCLSRSAIQCIIYYKTWKHVT